MRWGWREVRVVVGGVVDGMRRMERDGGDMWRCDIIVGV